MKTVGSQTRADIQDTEYTLIKQKGKGAILLNRDYGKMELWYQKDDFAGYVVVIDGIGYKFVRVLKGYKL